MPILLYILGYLAGGVITLAVVLKCTEPEEPSPLDFVILVFWPVVPATLVLIIPFLVTLLVAYRLAGKTWLL